MSCRRLNTAVIKAKSEELQIPFANLALAFVMEEFLIRVSESEDKNLLWLRNPANVSLERYKRKLVTGLSFFYRKDLSKKKTEEESDKERIEALFEKLCASWENQNLEWSYQIVRDGRTYMVELTVRLEQIRIPFQVKIEILEREKVEPRKLCLRMKLRSNDQIELYAYPAELVAADMIFLIMEKLELINDMSVYRKLIEILKKEPLDGRKVQQYLLENCRRGNMDVKEERLSMLLGYRSYGYMKKKWQRYLKSEQQKTPEWEELFQLLERFLTPIWKLMCSDLIFIGDWMPELERFLD